MDSIRQTLKNAPDHGRNDIINRIRLVMNADIERKRVFLLVEGSDDQKFVRYTLSKNVDCFESPGGKRVLYDLLKSDEIASERVIAIRDRDYSTPEDYPDRMFAYDHCALELMILFHPTIRNRMRNHCESVEDKKDFPLPTMRHIAPFSLLRQKNEKQHLMLRLNKGILSGLQGHSELPDMPTLFLQTGIPDRLLAICCQEAETLADETLWDITNGHDICAVLARISRLAGNRTNEDGYRAYLLDMYRPEDFCDTKLFHELFDYQQQHQLSILKVPGGETDAI